MAERLEEYLEDVSERLKGRASETQIDELLQELRAHHEAAVELFAGETDPETAALELMGSSRFLADRYRKENPRGGSRTALALVLVIAAVFYLQPTVYVLNRRVDYLASMPLIWVNVAACFVAACIWYRRSAFVPILACVMVLGAGLTAWLTPSFVWVREFGGENRVLIPRRSAEHALSANGYYASRREMRRTLARNLERFAEVMSNAKSPSDLANLEYSPKFGTRYTLPQAFVLSYSEAPRDTTSFAVAKAAWSTWEEVLAALDNVEAAEKLKAEELRSTLARGPWASWFPLACRVFTWSAGALFALTILNGLARWLVRLIDRVDWRRPGVA